MRGASISFAQKNQDRIQAIASLRSSIARRPFLRDLTLTSGAEAAVIVSGLAVMSILGHALGAVALGQYLLVRRVVAWLQTGAQLGLPLAVARQVAFATEQPARERTGYLLAALACAGTLALLVSGALQAAPTPFAEWLLGEGSRVYLIAPLALLLLGLVVHVIVYGYYRGHLAMKRANLLQVLGMALTPVACVAGLYWTHSVGLIVGAMGICTLLIALAFAAPLLPLPWDIDGRAVWNRARELLRYGLPRVPGDFGLAALVALGPILAAHFLPLEQVSAFLLGQSLVILVGAAAAPLNLVLLPTLSMMLAQNQLPDVRERLGHLTAAAIHLSVFVGVQLLIFVDVLLRAWVGPGFEPHVDVIRLLLVAIPFWLFYNVLRVSIDAARVTAHNARHILISLAVFLLLSGALVKTLPRAVLLHGLAGALVLAFLVLAVLTARIARRLYGLRLARPELAPGVLAAILLGGAALLVRQLGTWSSNIAFVLLLEVALSGLFVWLLKSWRTPWLLFFLDSVGAAKARELAAKARELATHPGPLAET